MARIALIFLVLVLCFVSALGQPTAKPAASLVEAKAAILMDRATGMVLWEKNADWRLPMASTTKIMTAMVILDHGRDRLDERVTISHNAASIGGSSVFAEKDTAPMGDMLKAILIKSSNEGCIAVAEHLAGSEAAFVAWMNEKAADLHLRQTHFVNAHGLYAPDHTSSARDLAIMGREAMTHYPEIRKIVTMGRKSFALDSQPKPRYLLTHNHLLGKLVSGVPGSVVDGIKTGFVNESGYCFVGSATLDGWQLIAVVLNSPQSFTETNTLFHYGFTRYRWQPFTTPGAAGIQVPVARAARTPVALGTEHPLGAPVPCDGDDAANAYRVHFRGEPLTAPVRKGATVGTLELSRAGKVIASAPAITLAEVQVAWWANIFVLLGWIAGMFLVLFVIGKIYGTRTKAARRRRRLLQTPGGEAYHGRPRDGER